MHAQHVSKMEVMRMNNAPEETNLLRSGTSFLPSCWTRWGSRAVVLALREVCVGADTVGSSLLPDANAIP